MSIDYDKRKKYKISEQKLKEINDELILFEKFCKETLIGLVCTPARFKIII